MEHSNCPLCRRELPPLVLPSQREVPARQDNESSARNPVMGRLIRTPALRRPTHSPALPLPRAPAQIENPVSRDPMNNYADEADQAPRWTPDSIRRRRPDALAGEASSAMAQLSIEDDNGEDGDVDASATTGIRAPCA